MTEDIIDTCIKKKVTLHDILHGFRVGREMGTDIMEVNLSQDLASVNQDSLFLVFLDLRESYDNMDCGWILKTFEGYGAGLRMRGIMEEF